MKLWLEVYVEPCPPHTGLYVAQEVAKYPSGRIETTHLASAIDKFSILNEIHALGYRQDPKFVKKPTEDLWVAD